MKEYNLPVGTPINGKNFYHRGHPLTNWRTEWKKI